MPTILGATAWGPDEVWTALSANAARTGKHGNGINRARGGSSMIKALQNKSNRRIKTIRRTIFELGLGALPIPGD